MAIESDPRANAVVLVFVVVPSAPAWAQKTDVVTLINGDRSPARLWSWIGAG